MASISGGRAFAQWATAQLRLVERWRHVRLVEGADVGSGRDDLIDAVEDIVGEYDVHPREEVVELLHGVGAEQGARDSRVHARPERYVRTSARKTSSSPSRFSASPSRAKGSTTTSA